MPRTRRQRSGWHFGGDDWDDDYDEYADPRPIFARRSPGRAGSRDSTPPGNGCSDPARDRSGLVAQHAAEDLAARRLGDLVDELDQADALVARDVTGHVLLELLGRQVGPGLTNEDSAGLCS